MGQDPRRHRAPMLAVTAFLSILSPSLVCAQSERADQLFQRLDVNGDGRISRDEFDVKKVEIIFAGSTGRGARLRFEDTKISRSAFDAMDLDHDGTLTAGEVAASPIFTFDTWDKNADGYIDRNEFVEQLHRIDR